MKTRKTISILIAGLILMLSLAVNSHGAKPIDANVDLAAGMPVYGTFTNGQAATDGKTGGLSAVSGDTTESPQYLTINLGKSLYLDRVKVFWDKNALSNDFVVRTSSDARYWVEEARNLDAATGVLDDATGKVAISVSLSRAVISSKYVQIMVPAGTKITNPQGKTVKIAEVEVYPSVNQKFTLDQVSEYAAMDTSFIIMYKTSIGAASGTITYGTNPNNMDKSAGNSSSGVVNSVVILGLKPRTTYFYQVSATDYYGNTVSSKVLSFTTVSENVALHKMVTGTFTELPKGERFAKPGTADQILSRVTDGGTSYFTAMATSGSVPGADQYVVIDLGKSYNLKSISSYWRNLSYPESLTVQVSGNGIDWKTLESGLNAGAGAFARSDAGDPMNIVNVKGDSGRYIKLLVPKGSPIYCKHSDWDFVQLMEVKAFAQ